jgi:chitodextrinase
MKTWLCAVSAATLVACGGGDDAPATPTTSTASTEALTSLTEGSAAAGALAVEGLASGYFGNLSRFDILLPARLSPAAVESNPNPECTAGSTARQGDTVTYTDCVIDGATLNGVIQVTSDAGSYTVTFDSEPANPFRISAPGVNAQTITYTYNGNEVITGLSDAYPYTAGRVVVNATVKINTDSEIKLINYTVEFSTNVDRTVATVSVNGDYEATIKLSDFGVPLTPGLPETVPVQFTISTPTPIESIIATDEVTAGVYRMSSAGFVIEVDFGAKKIRMTPTGAPTQEFDLVL